MTSLTDHERQAMKALLDRLHVLGQAMPPNAISMEIQRALKKYREPRKKKPDTDRCKDCGGKKRGYADDYFIKKCYCDDLRDAERPDWYEEQ